MDLNVFVIVVSVLLALQIVMIVLHIDIIGTVKAGNKNDHHFRYSLSAVKASYLRIGDKTVDVSSLLKLRVRGNSMKDYNIHDGQTVFVESLDGGQAKEISNHPVVVFSLKDTPGCRPFDSRLKMRKFIAYIQLSDKAEVLYDKYKDRIKLSLSEFTDEYEKRRKELQKVPDKGKYILSSTFNEATQKYHCSIHNTELVTGVVKYVS